MLQAEKNRALLAALLDVTQPQETGMYRTDERGQAVALAEVPAEEQYQAAFRRWDVDVDGMALEELARRFEQQPPAVRDEIVAGLDGWLRHRQRKEGADRHKLRELADRLDEDGPRKELRRLRESGAPEQQRQRLRERARQAKSSGERVLRVAALVRTLFEAG